MRAGLANIETPFVPFIDSITVERLRPDAKLPEYASDGDSGMDVFAPEEYVIQPGQSRKIDLGIKIGIPAHPFKDFGYRFELQVRPRSGVSFFTDLIIKNSPGTIDNYYRDEIGVLIKNGAQLTDQFRQTVFDLKGREVIPTDDYEKDPSERNYRDGTIIIRKGDKFAQLVFAEVLRPFEIIEGEVTDEDSRGGGFGHSGL